MTETMREIQGGTRLLTALVGSHRYGYASEGSNRDYFCLTPKTAAVIQDPETRDIVFVVSAQEVKKRWGHPFLMGNLTADCEGNEALRTFLAEHRLKLPYAAPSDSVMHGLDYISSKETVAERLGRPEAAKPSLLAAFILAHMAQEMDDPFLLSDEEKSVLVRARAGEVGADERAETYRSALCRDNLDKLRKMPDNTALRDEFFRLLDEIVKEET